MKNIGIWLDKTQAIIVNTSNNPATIEVVASDYESRVRFDGEDKDYTRMGGNFLQMKNQKLKKTNAFSKNFIKALSLNC